MFAKQLTVFLENRSGRLSEVLAVLKENDINILTLSLADTTEYGLLRLIVDNAELGKAKLSERGFSSLLTDVLIIETPHKAGSLQSLLKIIDDNALNIEYMYALSVNGEDAYIVLKSSDGEVTEKILTENGVVTVGCDALKI